MQGFSLLVGHMLGDFILQNDWMAAKKTKSSDACAVHCLIYTLALLATCWWFLPWWTYPVIGLAHFPVDRWRLARKCMDLTGQANFATGPFAPWSVIIVDQTMHFVVLYLVALPGALYG